MYTFVSGLETLYVAGRVILLHSHLLPQRLGSHPIDNAIANLQRPMHVTQLSSENACGSTSSSFSCLVLPVLPVVWGCRSQTPGRHFSTRQRCSETRPPPHSAPGDTHHFLTCLLMFAIWCVFLPFTVRPSHWPAEGVDPWRGEPTLSTPAENNQLPISSHLQYSAERRSW